MFSTSKENILKKIRKALTESTPLPFPKSEGSDTVYTPALQEMEIEFAEQFVKLQGRFVFCQDQQELAYQLNNLVAQMEWKKIFVLEDEVLPMLSPEFSACIGRDDLAGCDVSITGCEHLVARTGSIVLSSRQLGGRNTSVYAPIHICIARAGQLVWDVKDALQLLKDKYREDLPSLITFATGPSRTADIEKTLVVGVHGPKEVYVFLVDDPA